MKIQTMTSTLRVNYQTLAYLPNLNPDEELSASSVRIPTRYGVGPIYCTRGLPLFAVVEGNAAGSVQISLEASNTLKTSLQTLLEPDTLLRTKYEVRIPFGTETKPGRFDLALASLIGLALVILTVDLGRMYAKPLPSFWECFIGLSTVEKLNLTKPLLEARCAQLAVVNM